MKIESRKNGRFTERVAGQAGVTLVELLVALVIAGLVFAGVYQIYTSSVRSNAVQDQVVDMQQTGRVVLDQLVKELRLAGYAPNSPTGIPGVINYTGPNPLELNPNPGSPGQFEIQGDFNGDGQVETVIYKIDKTDASHPWLTRQSSLPAVTSNFGSNIENVSFTFYDDKNCKIGDPLCPVYTGDKVRRITVKVTARTDKKDVNFVDPTKGPTDPDRHYRRRSLESDVVLRNTTGAVDKTPPGCPKNVTAALTGDCRVIRVTWTRADDPYNDLAGYFIYYDTNPINTDTSPSYNILEEKNKPMPYQVDISVPADGLYNVAVTSYDRSGNLCDSNAVNGNPPADPVTASGSPVNVTSAANKTPAAPGSGKAIPSDRQVELNWGEVNANTDGTVAKDLVGYRLFRSTNPSFSDEVQIADEFALPIAAVAGKDETTHTNRYLDNSQNTFISGSPSGPANCTIYYYRVSVVDNCSLESARLSIESKKNDGSFSPGVTPPDNGMGPPAPTVTSLVAGDDTSAIIVYWSIPAPGTNESTPVKVKIFWRKSGDASWNEPPLPAPVEVPISTLPASGQYIVNNLAAKTEYDFKVTAYDDPATGCGDPRDSAIESLNTNECAPRLRAHKLVPGISAGGTSVLSDGSAVIGSQGPSLERYVTWVADPTDCTPDSTNFDSPGFDYKNPPTYSDVAYDPGTNKSARVEFFINPPGATSDTLADQAYGTAASGSNPGNPFSSNSANVDYAPRGGDGYYHFPFDPLNSSHIDTARLCDARYDFKILAVDGEEYDRPNTIPVEVNNGGIVVDPAATVTTDFASPTTDDIHNIARFGIKNTNSAKDLKLNKITLDWSNLGAYLYLLEVVKADKTTVIGKWDASGGSPSGRADPGTELILNPVPVLNRAGSAGDSDKAYLRLTFKDSLGAVTSGVDLRQQGSGTDGKITITNLVQQDAAASGTDGTCTSLTAGEAVIHKHPTIEATATVMDKPAAETTLSKDSGERIVASGSYPTISTQVTPHPGVPIDSVKLYYKVDNQALATAPARPSNAGGGGNYTLSLGGSLSGVKYLFPMTGITPGTQVWFYLEALDGTAGDPFNRNFDIYPDQSAFTYVQCGTLNPTVTLLAPTANNVTDVQNVNVSVGTTVPISSVRLTITALGSKPPEFTGTKNMCLGLDADCNGTPGGTTQSWTTSYNSDAADGSTNIKHSILITATDACGTEGTATKNLN